MGLYIKFVDCGSIFLLKKILFDIINISNLNDSIRGSQFKGAIWGIQKYLKKLFRLDKSMLYVN